MQTIYTDDYLETKTSNDDKILIEIPAYMDPELINTITSAYIQADDPDRIVIAICYQDDDEETLEILKRFPHLKIVAISKAETRGTCYARYLCQQQLEDEKYILHIDSHMRFIKHWDTEMIKEYLAMNDDMAVLSSYPAAFSDDDALLDLKDEKFDTPKEGSVIYAHNFIESSKYRIHFKPRGFTEKDVFPKRGVWISGGFVFTKAQFDRDIPYDYNDYFYGDEQPIAIRAFTCGYNVYVPKMNYVLHKYCRKERKMPDNPESKKASYLEVQRTCNLLKLQNDINLGEFGLGNKRTLKEFEDFAGISFKNKVLTKKAEMSYFTEKIFEDGEISEYQKNKQKIEKDINKSKIHVIIACPEELTNAYECIDSAKEYCSDKNNIDFTVVTYKKYKDKNNTYDTLYVDEKTPYAGFFCAYDYSKLSKNDYVLLIDSKMRFIKEFDGVAWDTFLKKNIIKVGQKAALGSYAKTCFEPQTNVFFNYTLKVNGFYHNRPTFINDKLLNKNGEYTLLLRDGFLFARVETLINVPLDPNLSFNELNFLYAIRLFTNGYDIYYPIYTYMYRLNYPAELDKLGEKEDRYYTYDLICGYKNHKTVDMDENYPYKVGNKRSPELYFEQLKIDFDKKEKL